MNEWMNKWFKTKTMTTDYIQTEYVDFDYRYSADKIIKWQRNNTCGV